MGSNLRLPIDVIMNDQASKGLGLIDGIMVGLGQKIVDLGIAAVKFGAQMAWSLGTEAVAAASDLEEQTNKFNVVFRGMTEQAGMWRDELVASYMMSSVEATALMASMQDLLKPMGMAAGAAGQMSVDVIKLAADMSSFNNMPTADVLADIRSALVGQSEPMLKYGSDTRAAAVQQMALAMGLGGVGRELTQAEKAMATYQIILKSNTDAVGDIDRSSTSYANSLKLLNGRWQDFLAMAAESLLPVLADIYRWLSDVATAAIPMAQSIVEGFSERLRSVFEWMRDTAMPIVMGLMSYMADAGIWQSILDLAGWGFGRISALWQAFAQGQGESVNVFFRWMAANISAMYTAWIDPVLINIGMLANMFFVAVWNNARHTIANLIQDIAGEMISSESYFTSRMGYALNNLGDILHRSGIEPVKGQLMGLGEWAYQSWDTFNGESQDGVASWAEQTKNQFKKFVAKLSDDGTTALNAVPPKVKSTGDAVVAEGTSVVNSLSSPGTGASGYDAAEGYIGGWDQVWQEAAVPAYTSNFDTFVGAAQDAAEEVAAAAQAAQQSWADLTIPGSQTSSGYQWNGHFYVFSQSQNEWGYEDWRNGLPYWQSAPSAFYDAFGLSQALTGGLIDLFKGVIPSFQRGGEVPIIAHAGEVVIPTAQSGYNYQGMQVGAGGQVQGGGNITINVYALSGYDAIHRAVKEIWPHAQAMQRRGEIGALA